MGTLIVKCPYLKGFYAIMSLFCILKIYLINSNMSTIFLLRGYNYKLFFELLKNNYISSSKNV